MEAFEASLRLDLSLLRGLRRQLQSWLAQVGVPDDAAEAIVLATHEAAANAIEHAEFGTEVTIEGTRDDDQLRVVVTNTGPWKRPRSADESRERPRPHGKPHVGRGHSGQVESHRGEDVQGPGPPGKRDRSPRRVIQASMGPRRRSVRV